MVQQRANEAHLGPGGLSYDWQASSPLTRAATWLSRVLVNGVAEKTHPVCIDTAPSPRPQLSKADKNRFAKNGS